MSKKNNMGVQMPGLFQTWHDINAAKNGTVAPWLQQTIDAAKAQQGNGTTAPTPVSPSMTQMAPQMAQAPVQNNWMAQRNSPWFNRQLFHYQLPPTQSNPWLSVNPWSNQNNDNNQNG